MIDEVQKLIKQEFIKNNFNVNIKISELQIQKYLDRQIEGNFDKGIIKEIMLQIEINDKQLFEMDQFIYVYSKAIELLIHKQNVIKELIVCIDKLQISHKEKFHKEFKYLTNLKNEQEIKYQSFNEQFKMIILPFQNLKDIKCQNSYQIDQSNDLAQNDQIKVLLIQNQQKQQHINQLQYENQQLLLHLQNIQNNFQQNQKQIQKERDQVIWLQNCLRVSENLQMKDRQKIENLKLRINNYQLQINQQKKNKEQKEFQDSKAKISKLEVVINQLDQKQNIKVNLSQNNDNNIQSYCNFQNMDKKNKQQLVLSFYNQTNLLRQKLNNNKKQFFSDRENQLK